MDLQGFDQMPGVIQGNTQVLPPIQGNTQVLPTISHDGLVQGTNTVLQETAGLAGPTDANGFFGTTATTNDIFGETLKTTTETTDFGTTFTGTTTDANAFLGDNQYIQNVDTNTFFGTAGTTDGNAVFGTNQITTDPLLTNQTLAGTQFLPAGTDTNTFFTTDAIPTTTDATTLYGTTQIMPDATAFGTQVGGVTQTTTTTQTTYNTNPGFQTFGATTFPTTQTTFGTTEGIPVTQGFTMQNEYQATGQTTPDSNIGYGTTPAEFAAAQANYTTTDTLQTTAYEIPKTTQTTTQTTTQIQNIPQTTVTQTLQATPNPVAAQNQIIQNTQIQPQSQAIQAIPQQQIIQNAYGARILDEDFRRGRPIYTDTRTTGYRLNNNLPVRPSYNVINTNNSRLLNYGYTNPTIGLSKLGNNLRTNNVPLGTGLDRLAKGGSYDVYSRGINPLYNQAGLGQVKNIQATSNIKDFL